MGKLKDIQADIEAMATLKDLIKSTYKETK